MKKNFIILLFALGCIALFLGLILQHARQREIAAAPRAAALQPSPPVSVKTVSRAAATVAPAMVSPTAPAGVSIPAVPPPAPPPASVEPLPPDLAKLPPETVLENMRTAVRNYGSTFAGNPVGTNPEITRALAGDNPRHINFLKADGNRVNTNGELVDPWGTPYFFHQLSATQMEIRSAGPDRVMWTADDFTIQ